MTRYAFLPGSAGRGSFWEPVCARLVGEGDHAEVFDWPGFGDVPVRHRIAGYDDLATLVIDRLEHVGPSVVLAQSMGGYVAVLVAERRPDLVTELVLAATSAGVDLATFSATDWRPGSRAAHPDNPAWMWEPTRDLTRVLERLPMPVLLIWATDDEISPVAVGVHLQTLIPRSRLVTYRSDDHWVARVNADRVADEVRSLVGSRRALGDASEALKG